MTLLTEDVDVVFITRVSPQIQKMVNLSLRKWRIAHQRRYLMTYYFHKSIITKGNI